MNAPTSVSNGVFTMLDFAVLLLRRLGPLAGTGSRTNGSTVSIHHPGLLREAITSVPYAIQADKAKNVAATNINGTLSLTQLRPKF